jgi:hypothetical protein
MKKIIISSLLVINLLHGNNIALDQSIKDKIVILDNEREYQTSRELLNDFITNDNKMDSLKFWLVQDKKILQNLYFSKNKLTLLRLKQSKVGEKTAKKYAIENMWSIIPVGGLVKGAYDTYKGQNSYQTYNSEKNNYIQYVNSYDISLFDISNAKKILKQFDELKKSQKKLNYILKEYIKESDTQEFKKILPLLKEVKNFKNNIKTRRTNFISYTVISPYLADAQRYIILSDLDTIGHNEEYLKKAAKSMAKGAYKDILLESNEDVRDQFYTVFQKLKNTAGEKEWEDLKVLQTLMDSSSDAKKTGADKWWE